MGEINNHNKNFGEPKDRRIFVVILAIAIFAVIFLVLRYTKTHERGSLPVFQAFPVGGPLSGFPTDKFQVEEVERTQNYVEHQSVSVVSFSSSYSREETLGFIEPYVMGQGFSFGGMEGARRAATVESIRMGNKELEKSAEIKFSEITPPFGVTFAISEDTSSGINIPAGIAELGVAIPSEGLRVSTLTTSEFAKRKVSVVGFVSKQDGQVLLDDFEKAIKQLRFETNVHPYLKGVGEMSGLREDGSAIEVIISKLADEGQYVKIELVEHTK